MAHSLQYIRFDLNQQVLHVRACAMCMRIEAFILQLFDCYESYCWNNNEERARETNENQLIYLNIFFSVIQYSQRRKFSNFSCRNFLYKYIFIEYLK